MHLFTIYSKFYILSRKDLLKINIFVLGAKMDRPLVSIITPTYNHEKFIGQCIESVLAQTFPDWEQIIIDDGSTDSTPRIVKRYKDSRIKYIRQEHRGLYNLVNNYNYALSLSKGDFIAILEGDDFWPDYKLEKQLNLFDSPDVILTWGKGVVTDEKGKVLYIESGINTKNKFEDFSSASIALRMRRGYVFVPTCTVIIRKDVLLKHGGFISSPSKIYVDLPTFLKVIVNSHGIFRFINLILGYYRNHPNQVTSFTRAQQFKDHALLLKMFKIKGHDSYSKFLLAKSALIEQDWKTCRRLFLELLFDKSIEKKDKKSVILGFLSSLIRVNLLYLLLLFQQRSK